MRRALVCCLVLLGGAGCGSDDDFDSEPVDVSGSYTVAVTNTVDGCHRPGFDQGAQLPGIPLTITQSGSAITATIEGLAGIVAASTLGSNTFEGTVSGDHVSAMQQGSAQHTQDGCTFTVDAEFDATLTGNALQGTVEYRPNTTGSPECAALDGCVDVQEFSGSRPPK